MVVYGVLKNTNKVMKEDSIGVSIDGIQLELNKDFDNTYCKGADIYLDFSGSDYFNKGGLKSFRLKSVTIQIDGNETDLEDNSEFVYQLIKSSKVKEFIISGVVLEDMEKIEMLGSLKFDIGGRIVHLKTNKTRFY